MMYLWTIWLPVCNPFEIGKDHFEMGVCRRGHMGGEQGYHWRDRHGLFGSDNNCTRAQIVTFLYRYVE